jgi:hypothetical protein
MLARDVETPRVTAARRDRHATQVELAQLVGVVRRLARVGHRDAARARRRAHARPRRCRARRRVRRPRAPRATAASRIQPFAKASNVSGRSVSNATVPAVSSIVHSCGTRRAFAAASSSLVGAAATLLRSLPKLAQRLHAGMERAAGVLHPAFGHVQHLTQILRRRRRRARPRQLAQLAARLVRAQDLLEPLDLVHERHTRGLERRRGRRELEVHGGAEHALAVEREAAQFFGLRGGSGRRRRATFLEKRERRRGEGKERRQHEGGGQCRTPNRGGHPAVNPLWSRQFRRFWGGSGPRLEQSAFGGRYPVRLHSP